MYEGDERRKSELDLATIKEDVREIKELMIGTQHVEGICQRVKKVEKLLYGNGTKGLCEQVRFLGVKVAAMSGIGVGVFYVIRELFDKIINRSH